MPCISRCLGFTVLLGSRLSLLINYALIQFVFFYISKICQFGEQYCAVASGHLYHLIEMWMVIGTAMTLWLSYALALRHLKRYFPAPRCADR